MGSPTSHHVLWFRLRPLFFLYLGKTREVLQEFLKVVRVAGKTILPDMQETNPISGNVVDSETSFGNTDWWTIRQAGSPGQPDSDPARSRLCQTYWMPVFHHILHSGYPWHDAQDLTQEFFSRLLSNHSLETATNEKGKFRSFLLTLVKRFLADQLDRARAQKRGSGLPTISLDQGDTEFLRRIEPKTELDPEHLCERKWVETILEQSLDRLEAECAAANKGEIFRELKSLVTREEAASYASVAAAVQLTEGNVRTIVHRLRHRLRELLTEATVMASAPNSNPGQDLLQVYASA